MMGKSSTASENAKEAQIFQSYKEVASCSGLADPASEISLCIYELWMSDPEKKCSQRKSAIITYPVTTPPSVAISSFISNFEGQQQFCFSSYSGSVVVCWTGVMAFKMHRWLPYLSRHCFPGACLPIWSEYKKKETKLLCEHRSITHSGWSLQLQFCHYDSIDGRLLGTAHKPVDFVTTSDFLSLVGRWIFGLSTWTV